MEYAMASAAVVAATDAVGLANTVRSLFKSNEMNTTVSGDVYKWRHKQGRNVCQKY